MDEGRGCERVWFKARRQPARFMNGGVEKNESLFKERPYYYPPYEQLLNL